MALVLPELAKDVDISPNEVFQNTGVRASVSGLADAVDLATSSVASAEALKVAGYHTIVVQHGNRTSNAVDTMEAVKLPQLAAATKQGSLPGVCGGGVVVRSHAAVGAGAGAAVGADGASGAGAVQVQVTLAAIIHVCGSNRIPDAEVTMEHAIPTLRMWVLLLRRGIA